MKSLFNFSYIFFPALAVSIATPSFAQLGATQVINFTVGNRGSVTTERSFTTTESTNNNSFSLTTDEQTVNERTVSNEGGTQTIQTDNFQINSGAFVSQTEKTTEVRTIQIFDTFEYIDSTFSQSFSASF